MWKHTHTHLTTPSRCPANESSIRATFPYMEIHPRRADAMGGPDRDSNVEFPARPAAHAGASARAPTPRGGRAAGTTQSQRARIFLQYGLKRIENDPAPAEDACRLYQLLHRHKPPASFHLRTATTSNVAEPSLHHGLELQNFLNPPTHSLGKGSRGSYITGEKYPTLVSRAD